MTLDRVLTITLPKDFDASDIKESVRLIQQDEFYQRWHATHELDGHNIIITVHPGEKAGPNGWDEFLAEWVADLEAFFKN